MIRHLLGRGSECPKVLVATHFHDVFREDLLDPASLPISFRHMQVMFTGSDGRILDGDEHGTERERKVLPGDKITYLYR